MSNPDPVGAIVSYLGALLGPSGELSASVYGGEIPRSHINSMPVNTVLVTPAGGGSLGVGTLQAGDTRLDIDCYASTIYASWQLYLLVKRYMKYLERESIDDTLLMWAQESAAGSTGRDPDTDWPVTPSTWQIFAGQQIAA